MASVDAMDEQLDIEAGNQAAGQAREEQKKLEADFKIKSWERSLFNKIHNFMKEDDWPFIYYFIFEVAQHAQLIAYSWRDDVDATNIVRYILHPLLAFVETNTLASHIIGFLLTTLTFGLLIHCVFFMNNTGVGSPFTLKLLRLLTRAWKTFLIGPILITYVMPTQVKNGTVFGYTITDENTLKYALWATGAASAAFTVPFILFSTILYYNWSPKCEYGQRNGRLDLFHNIFSMAIAIVYVVANKSIAEIITAVLCLLLLIYNITTQSYYGKFMNNFKSAGYGAALFSSIIFLIKSFVPEFTYETGIGIGLAAIALGGGFGYFINKYLVKRITSKVLDSVDYYNTLFNTDQSDITNDKMSDISKSYLDLICDQALDVASRIAVREEIKAFPNALWADITSRFIRQAYLDKDAVILVNQMFTLAFKQFPEASSIYLTYIAYIDSYFDFLVGDEYTLLSVLLRKCKIRFDEKFRIFVQQQVVAEWLRSTNSSGDQYSTNIEYRSLERSAKEHHLKAINEFKEFWTAVRSNEPAQILSSRLISLSAFVKKTNDLYSRLLERFPDSRNAQILYSRFLMKVSGDKEKAEELMNTIEDNNSIGENDDEFKNNDDVNNLEKKSEGKSSRTSASKEARLLKQKRDLLYARLASPINNFLQRVKLGSFLFIALLVSCVAVCKVTLDKTNSSFDDLEQAMIARRLTYKVYSSIRTCQIFAREDQDVQFNKSYNIFLDRVTEWKEKAFKVFATQVLSNSKQDVIEWNNIKKSYKIEAMNPYQASEAFWNYANYLAGFGNTLETFKAKEEIFKNPKFMQDHVESRFIFDNIETLYSLFDQDCQDVTDFFAQQVNSEIIILAILTSLVGLLLITVGLVLPLMTFSSIHNFKYRIIELLKNIPRNLINNLVIELEEEHDIFTGEDNSTHNTIYANDAKKKAAARARILKADYLITWILLAASFSVMVGVTFYFAITTQKLPQTYSLSNIERTDLPEKISTWVLEEIYGDESTFTSTGIKLRLDQSIEEMQNTRLIVQKQLDPFLQDRSSGLFKSLRDPGMCHYADGCDKHVDTRIGLTKELLEKPIDSLLQTFVDRAIKYQTEKNFDVSNPEWELISALADQFEVSALTVQKNILDLVDGLVMLYTLIIFISFGAAIILSLITFYTGFIKRSNQANSNHEQLIAVLYSIPLEERRKLPELHTFLDSGGAILV